MKHKLTLLTIALCTTSAIAAQQSNFYFGANGGLQILSNKRITTIDPFGPGANSVNKDTDGGIGGTGGLFAGYDFNFGKGSLAIEASGNIDATKATEENLNWQGTGQDATLKTKQQGHVFVSVLPGIALNNNTKVFLRGGYALGKFEFQSHGLSGPAFGVMGNTNKWLSGFVAGAGIQTFIEKNVSLRFEYDFSQYKKQHFMTNVPLELGGGSVSSEITPRSHQFLASIAYHIY